MAVVQQKPCNNEEILELAKDAEYGWVLTHIEGVTAWRPRDPEWKGALLTYTPDGFELIDENGKSYGLLNLGEAYSGINKDKSCKECGREYKWQRDVICIPSTDDDSVFGKCGDKWVIEWCPICTCYGIESISGRESYTEIDTEGNDFKYVIDLTELCGCDEKILDKVQLDIHPIENP